MGTQADILTRVMDVFKRDDKADEVNRAIKDAYGEMVAILNARRQEERVYKNITANRAECALPDSFLRLNHPIKLIDPVGGGRSTSSYPLDFMTKEEYDFWEPYPDGPNPVTGIPWGYSIWKNSIYLTNIPDKSYTLEINLGGEPGSFTNLTDLSIFSSVFDETIAAGALQRLFGNVKLYEDSKYWAGIYGYGHIGDVGVLVGGLKLLQQIEVDNKQAVRIVRNNPL